MQKVEQASKHIVIRLIVLTLLVVPAVTDLEEFRL
jgi:hypothetical protein